MNLAKCQPRVPLATRLDSGVPLWKVVPTRDQDGCLLTDFMMLVPRLRNRSQPYIETTLENIQAVLGGYQEVVFADFNLPINVLWVSLRPRPGLTLEVVAAIRSRVPEALLVAQRPTF